MQHSKIINALDIGTSKVTTIVGQYFDSEDRFNVVAVASVPSLGFRKGQIINLDQATKTISQSIESAERMAGFEIHHAVISISAPYVESTNSHGVVAISSPNSEITSVDVTRVIDAAKAVSLPAGKEIIHVIPRRYIVDGQEGVIDPIGMSGVRLELESHIILASTAGLKNLYKCLEEIGLKVDRLVYSGLPTGHAALTPTEKELGVALVDIGGAITTLTIYTEGSPVFSTVIPVGGSNITNDLAIGLRLSLDDAEKIKLKLIKATEKKDYNDEVDISSFGILSEEKHKINLQTAVNGIIKPRVEEIFNLIYQQIDLSGLTNSIPAGIVLTGGASQTINLKDNASKIIPLPIRIANPPKIGGLVEEIISPGFTSTIGLLMYSISEGVSQSNQSVKHSVNISGLFGRLRSLLEPLLP